MNEKQCEVCRLVTTLEPIHETEKWIIILNLDQGYLGRCFVTLKNHKGSLSELSSDEWVDLADVAGKLEGALTSAFGPKLFNWSCQMNKAFQEESPKPHVHWHIRPRYSKSVTFREIEYVDPEFGKHYDREQRFYADAKTLEEIKDAIKQHL